VIVLVPIAFRVPAVLVFIPPPVSLAPATLARRVEFVTLVIGSFAVASVSLDRTMQLMLLVDDPALTSIHIFRLKLRQGGRKQQSSNNR
jgi:hypothetical protein